MKVGRKKIDNALKARAMGYTFKPAQILFIRENGGSRFLQSLVNKAMSKSDKKNANGVLL
jgi:hypothetical protein